MELLSLRQIVTLCMILKFGRYFYRGITGQLEEPEPVFDIAARTGDAEALFLNDEEDVGGSTTSVGLYSSSPSFRLCNRTNVQFRIQPNTTATTSIREGDESRLIVLLVLSDPRAFESRNQFRRIHSTAGTTSASVGRQRKDKNNETRFRIIFVLGEEAETEQQQKLELESLEHDDILQLNHHEDYKSIYFKVLGGFVWVSQYCRAAQYIVKTDLGTVIDLDFLSRALDRSLSQRHNNDLRVECPFPFRLHQVHRPTPNSKSISGKWAISKEQFSPNICPDFCHGMLYSVTPQAALALAEASVSVPWDVAVKLSSNEDVFITGFLRQSVENMQVHSMLDYKWQRKLSEGVVGKCPVLKFFAVVFLNPGVQEKVSSDGVSYIRSPKFFLCSLIEALLKILDEPKLPFLEPGGLLSPEPLWDVCSRDKQELGQILVLFAFILAISGTLIILVLNIMVAVVLWLGRRLVVAWSWNRSNVILRIPLWSAKQRVD